MISQGIVIATQSHLYRVTSGYHIEIALLGFQGSHLWVKLVEFTKWLKKIYPTIGDFPKRTN
jgi:hypothetical protein